ncbi:hypothetical protein [Stenotrophobium rhamnosiphilum]|nr:hypothetical protein [Stenotrophobium rhamnosiphilum]
MVITTRDRVHAGFMVFTTLATLAYWLVYFMSGATMVRTDNVYTSFENAFPLADAWMAVGYLLAASFLLKGDRRAVLWGICAGSAMIFLGAIDILFNIEQGLFTHGSAEMAAEIAINIYCWTFGPFTIWRMWKHPLLHIKG